MADTAEQSVSLRDDLSKIYDSQESGETVEPEIEATAEEEEPKEKGRARDESGKFVKAEGETEEEAPEDGAEPEELAATPEPGLEAPQHWSSTDKAVFAKQPKEAQEFLLRRHKDMEADYTRKTQEVAETKRFKDTFDQLLTPYRQTFAMNGLDDVGGVRYLLGYFSALQQNPAATIQSLAQQYGVDLGQNQGGTVDPNMKPLLDKIQLLESQIAQTSQAQQYQVSSNLLEQVNSFRDEKDATGNLKHPHYETVRQDMSWLVGNGRAKSLQEAYEQAVRLHPDIYDKAIEQSILEKQKAEQQAAQKKVNEEAQKKAAQAKKAASGIRSGSASVDKQGPQTLRDTLSALYDKQAAS
jgi:hypothetical protein